MASSYFKTSLFNLSLFHYLDIQILKYVSSTFHKLIIESMYKYNYAPNSNYNFLSTSLADLNLLHCSPQPWWLTLRFDLHGCREPAMKVSLYGC